MKSRRARWLLAAVSAALLGLGAVWMLGSRRPAPTPTVAPPEVAKPRANGAIYSERPKSKIPVPRLPRSLRTRGPDDLLRVCQQIEQEVLRAGVTPAFARGVTGLLTSALGGKTDVEVHPVGLYYFIIREAGLGHDQATAARNLVASHLDQSIRRYSALPAHDRAP